MNDLALRLLVMVVERFLRYLLGPPTKRIRANKIPSGTIIAPMIASDSINSIDMREVGDM